MKFFICYFLLLLPLSVIWSQDAYSAADKEAFVKVYFESKQKNNKENLVTPLLSKYNVDAKRYGEIIRRKVERLEIKLSTEEQNLLAEIKQTQKSSKTLKQNGIVEKCEEHGISGSTYHEILNRYKADIKFQRSMKPFFDVYIKSLK